MSRYPHPADMNPDSSDPRSPYYDDSRDEWIAERADELEAKYLRDPEMVGDALGLLHTIGAGDTLESALLRFFMAFDSRSNEAMAEAGLELFETLDATVSKALREEAEMEAEAERERWELEQEEARAESRGGWEDAA